MNNFEFLTKYYNLQHSIMFDDLYDFGFALIGYSKGDTSSFWNNALVNTVLNGEQLSKIENQFKKLERKPVVYFENRNSLFDLVKFLQEKDYKEAFEDSWQFWKGEGIDKKHFEFVKKVTNPEELKVFLDTFNNCYQKGDPQNPYGELGDYLKVAERVWYKHNKTDRLEYFIVYKKGKPVSVSTLTNFKGIGYISNVGSLREVRGQGFGKAATLYCVDRSLKNENSQHCLATEEGEYPNEFYKRIGFETRFTAKGYTI